MEERGNTAGNISNNGLVATEGDWIYYSYRINYELSPPSSGEIFKINKDGSGKKRISNGDSDYLNIKGDWIYFRSLSDDNSLCRVDKEGKMVSKLHDFRCKYVSVVGDWVYIILERDNILCRMHIDDLGEKRGLGIGDVWNVNIVDGWAYHSDAERIYFGATGVSDAGNCKLYKKRVIDYKGFLSDPNTKKMDNKTFERIFLDDLRRIPLDNALFCNNVQVEDGWVYYTVSSSRSHDDKLYKVRTDGTDKTLLLECRIGCMNVSGNWIYYSNNDIGKGVYLYRIRTNGTENTQLSDINTHWINIANDWVYFCSRKDLVFDMYKIKTDGTELQMV